MEFLICFISSLFHWENHEFLSVLTTQLRVLCYGNWSDACGYEVQVFTCSISEEGRSGFGVRGPPGMPNPASTKFRYPAERRGGWSGGCRGNLGRILGVTSLEKSLPKGGWVFRSQGFQWGWVESSAGPLGSREPDPEVT